MRCPPRRSSLVRNSFLRPFPLCCAALSVAALLLAAPLSPGRKYTTVERLQPEHLEATHQARLRFAKERKTIPNVGVYTDYRAVMHVHAEDADHTKGTRPEVLTAAKAIGVNVVMWTDHRGPKPDTWSGMRDGVLFIPGSEDDHLLRFPKPGAELRFLSHLEETPDAKGDGFDGMEIYNRHTDAKDEKEFDEYFRKAMKDPVEWAKLVEKQKKYPDEVFGAETDYWPTIFAMWDREIAKHHFPGIAANDSHKNQIYNGTVFDPYEVSFLSDTTHILARELTDASIRESLRNGHVYVAHDWLCDPTGFSFVASNSNGVYDLGDTVPMRNNTRLVATLPIAAKIKLIKDGAVISETEGTTMSFTAKDPGAYRLEAWLAVDGEDRPWIYASPIYLEKAEPFKLPPTDLDANIEARKDISYVEGKPADEAKHKLDIYSPKGKTNLPVLVFFHGGSWRSGDRTNYPALANRFAKDGFEVVVPSYRLMPANPNPAQTEDATAAMNWVIQNIAQYGGDPKRIYLTGHSAGGHLAAYVGLNQKFWPNLKAVMPLSGVYDVSTIGGFQQDPGASPITHIRKGAPPFLITYCENDYPSLPEQARRFDAALRQAGDASQLVYVPGENHITEIIDIAKPDDVTAQAILHFFAQHQ
jgi:acetyl esterase/lipase